MSDAPRFKIGKGTTVYSLTSVDELSLLDLLALRAELSEIGITETWQEITAAVEEMAALEDDEDGSKNPDDHPLSLLVFAVTLWAARRKAGDGLRFADAVNVPMTSIQWLPKPADRQAAKSPGKRKGGAKKPRQASGRPGAAAAKRSASASTSPS